MTQDNLLSISDIAHELDTGKATISFLLKRFKNQILSHDIEGVPHYPSQTIRTLLNVKEKLDAGELPSRIEIDLKNDIHSSASSGLQAESNGLDTITAGGDDIRMSKDGLHLLKSLIQDIGEQQQRIAAAHEKRAVAEERKAVAIEKRALAEEKKADAMNNIAAALQEMNRSRTNDPTNTHIAHQAAAVIAEDENLENFLAEDLENIPGIEDISELEDLSDLLEETDPDLSDLIDGDMLIDSEGDPELAAPCSAQDNLSDLIEESSPDTDPDNENTLASPPRENHGLDDLNSLIDAPETQTSGLMPGDGSGSEENEQNTDLDDLSLLIDPQTSSAPTVPEPEIALDDLSLLVSNTSSAAETKMDENDTELDDLNKLIEGPPDISTGPKVESEVSQLDDLSLLIDTAADKAVDQSQDKVPMDDLSKLIDTKSPKAAPDNQTEAVKTDTPEFPDVSVDLSPKDNLEKYKAAVMKVIIGLKQDGLNVEKTTACLNHNKIQTLSGKPEWGTKAIAQIYKFIDAAK